MRWRAGRPGNERGSLSVLPRIPIWRFTTKTTKNTKPGEQRVGDDMPIENGVTQSVTDMRGETSLQEPIESGWNLVCLVSLVFLLRIPGLFSSLT
jgi:hypothetical protein